MNQSEYLFYFTCLLLTYGTAIVMSDISSLYGSRFMQQLQKRDHPENHEHQGVVWLCLDSTPDGSALIDYPGGDLLLLFKVDSFWTVKMDHVKDFILNNANPLVISSTAASVHGVWPNFPISPTNAISLNGLAASDVFYRNVFVFKGDNLYRYRIDVIKDDQIKKVGLIGIHKTTYWMEDPSESLIMAPRGGKLLGVLGFRSSYPFQISQGLLMQMTEKNMENPIAFDVHTHPIDLSGNSYIRLIHDVGEPKEFNIRTTGMLCIGDTCRGFLSHGICSFIDRFKNSFGFWLWYNTTFTFRLLMTALLGVMFINFTVASAFLWNQIKLITDMT